MTDITRTIQADGTDHVVETARGDTGTITLDGALRGGLTVLGSGDVHAFRTDSGHGNAYRSGNGDGDATRDGNGRGNADRSGNGYGNAYRSGIGYTFCEAGARRLTSPTSGRTLLIDVQHGTVRCGCFTGTLQELTDPARADLPPDHWAHKLTAGNLATITQEEL